MGPKKGKKAVVAEDDDLDDFLNEAAADADAAKAAIAEKEAKEAVAVAEDEDDGEGDETAGAGKVSLTYCTDTALASRGGGRL